MRHIPLSHRSHIIGFQPLGTGIAEHESTLERDFVTLCNFLDPHVRIVSQPITITFRDGARRARYTPDYFVVWSSGSREVVEVKYVADLQANRQRFARRFAAMERWATARDAAFRVATEREVRSRFLDNAKRLLPYRTAAIDAAVMQQVMSVVRRLRAPTFYLLLSRSEFADRAATLAAIWPMLARGLLRVDLSQPITPQSVITVL